MIMKFTDKILEGAPIRATLVEAIEDEKDQATHTAIKLFKDWLKNNNAKIVKEISWNKGDTLPSDVNPVESSCYTAYFVITGYPNTIEGSVYAGQWSFTDSRASAIQFKGRTLPTSLSIFDRAFKSMKKRLEQLQNVKDLRPDE